MPKFLTLLYLVIYTNITHGQQTVTSPTPIDSTILKIATIEEVLGLPSVYKVPFFDVTFSSKSEIFKLAATSWQDHRIRTFVLRGKPGDKLFIDAVIKYKDGVEKKLGTKTFIF
jgi:hypothetical protein